MSKFVKKIWKKLTLDTLIEKANISCGLTKYNLDSFQSDLYRLVQGKIKKYFYNTNNVICKVEQN